MDRLRDAAVNDITGDPIRLAKVSDKYRTGWDALFGKPKRYKDQVDLVLGPSAIVETVEGTNLNKEKELNA